MHKGKHLDDLQSTILRHSWDGDRYGEIADRYGCTEGHAKDMGSQLWRLLSSTLGVKVNKRNLQTALKRYLGKHLRQDLGYAIAQGQAYLQSDHGQAIPNPVIANAEVPENQSIAQNTTNHVSHETANPHFVGRSGAIAYLDHLSSLGTKVILIQAQGGVGKTTLARQYLQQKFAQVLEFAIAKETSNITSIESLIEERLQQLGLEPGREFGISLDRLKQKLAQTPIGILIDNLEPALDRHGKLIAPHRGYVELLVTLSAPTVRSLTLITSRDRLSESAIKLRRYLLPGLALSTWQSYFANYLPKLRPFRPADQVDQFDRYGELDLDQLSLDTIAQMHQSYGGNAKAMDILCSAIGHDFDGDVVGYWQEFQSAPLAQRDLANLVTSQFDRLCSLDLAAYRLLCRLGCYRYQDVSTIPSEAVLALLWDASINQVNQTNQASQPGQQRRLIESLRDRSLIEHHRGSYWLHPIIRAEAIARLRQANYETSNIEPNSELELAHRAAAKFWTDSTNTIDTVEDALRCFEAYYHYLAIEDYEAAAAVILQRRHTKSTGIERLGRTFYKLGLLKQMITAIAQIIDKIQSAYHLSGLYGIWGVLYRLSGQIHAAIECHQKSAAIAKRHLDRLAGQSAATNPTKETVSNQVELAEQVETVEQLKRSSAQLELLNLKNWQQHALLNIGICQIELWELEAAKQTFTQLNSHNRQQLIAEDLAELYNPSVDVFSAYVHSCLGDRPTALKFIHDFDRKLHQNISLGTGHRFLFLGLAYKNLGEIEPAFNMLNRAIDYANQHHYTQVKANAISGLAALERSQHNYQTALTHHQMAIELLAQIGTKCDLAEAYYQLGHTYAAQNDQPQSRASHNQAIKLFQEMQAPQQIKKVQRALVQIDSSTNN
ncbi:Tetratricopeptide TPR_1 repeat-containing protein [Thalassoporum mexicanum PCC 7367]|nr:Tetratricopeptide TPR_1 repeat-containing protein [Pseudanabaena sp. PCC 7367]